MSGYKNLIDKEKQLYNETQNKLLEYVYDKDYKNFDKETDKDKIDKYHIFSAIISLCNAKKNKSNPNFVIDYLKSYDNLEIISYIDNVEIIINDLNIKATILSGNIKNINDNSYDKQYLNYSNERNIMNLFSKLKSPSNIVTGYIYGPSNKMKEMLTWIEITKDDEEYVLDFKHNIIINKQAFYYLTSAEKVNVIDRETFNSDKKILDELENIEDIKEIYLAFRDELMKDVTFDNDDNKKTY